MKGTLLILVLATILTSCVKNNPNPAWLKVTAWQLQSNLAIASEGELTSNITNARLTINDNVIGIFEVPFKIPLLLSGNANIKVTPVVLNNGISSTKAIYPFLKVYEINADLDVDDTLTINPTTQYKDNVQFRIEDFESAGHVIQEDPSSVEILQTSTDPTIIGPYNGGTFGRVVLNNSTDPWIASTTFTGITAPNSQVYLEIDYYNTNSFTTGVLAINGSSVVDNPNIRVNSQDSGELKWKKIYIEMTEIIVNSPNAGIFEVSLQALLDDGLSSGEINIDNIKVLHF
ncbi:MAG: hypothetical protein MK066_12840 [Crocinitomicaceae bacterium]|nr:hypothetical protein [Crocinitomicaceae bacterium]